MSGMVYMGHHSFLPDKHKLRTSYRAKLGSQFCDGFRKAKPRLREEPYELEAMSSDTTEQQSIEKFLSSSTSSSRESKNKSKAVSTKSKLRANQPRPASRTHDSIKALWDQYDSFVGTEEQRKKLYKTLGFGGKPAFCDQFVDIPTQVVYDPAHLLTNVTKMIIQLICNESPKKWSSCRELEHRYGRFLGIHGPKAKPPWSASLKSLRLMTEKIKGISHLSHLYNLKKIFTGEKSRTCLHFDDLMMFSSPLGVYFIQSSDIDENYKTLFCDTLLWIHKVTAK